MPDPAMLFMAVCLPAHRQVPLTTNMNLDLISQRTIPAYAALADLLTAVRPFSGYADMGAGLITPADMPPAVRSLLVHEEHMTLRLKSTHGVDLALCVLAEKRHAGVYSREILLQRKDTQASVEFGIVRIQESELPAEVVERIVRREQPLGDILVDANLLRRIEPRWFYRFSTESEPARALGCATAFGRLGVIYCDDRPAIEVLEAIPDDRKQS